MTPIVDRPLSRWNSVVKRNLDKVDARASSAFVVTYLVRGCIGYKNNGPDPVVVIGGHLEAYVRRYENFVLFANDVDFRRPLSPTASTTSCSEAASLVEVPGYQGRSPWLVSCLSNPGRVHRSRGGQETLVGAVSCFAAGRKSRARPQEHASAGLRRFPWSRTHVHKGRPWRDG